MTSTDFVHPPFRAGRGAAQPFRWPVRTALIRALRALGAPRPQPWRLLDERQLRDIGMSPHDAYIARCARGHVELDAPEPIAAHGLSPAGMMRWVREGRRA